MPLKPRETLPSQITRSAGHRGLPDPCPVLVEGQLRIEIPQRIIGQRRQVNHRVKSIQVGGLDLAQVLHNLRNRDGFGSEG